MKRSYSIYRARLKRRINYQWNIILQSDMVTLLYFSIMKICEMFELLFENSRKEKTLKRFLEYCYMIDVKVALEGLNGEKPEV